MKKLLKNKKFLAITFGTVLVGASVVATAAACASKLTTEGQPTIDAKGMLTFKLSGENLPKHLINLKVTYTTVDKDGNESSAVVYNESKMMKEKEVNNESQSEKPVPVTEVKDGKVQIQLLSPIVEGVKKVIITSKQFNTNFVPTVNSSTSSTPSSSETSSNSKEQGK